MMSRHTQLMAINLANMAKYLGYTFLLLLGFVVDRLDGSTGDCPIVFTDSVSSTGTCLYFSRTERDWYRAREDCASYGADLVRVTSQTVADACKTMLDANGLKQYWIGLNDILTEYDYRWTNGDPLVWSNWGSYTDAYPQPNDDNYDQNCNIGDTDSNMLVPNTWQDKPCSESQPYICEYVPGENTIKTGNYRFRQASISSLINVQITSTTQGVRRLVCATECLKEPICDGYAFDKDSQSCSLLKLKETTSSERDTLQSKLTGSRVYIRNG